MRKIFCMMLALCLLAGSGFGEIDLQAAPEKEQIRKPPVISEGPLLEAPPMNLNCAGAMLVEAESGQILFEMNGDVERPVASVTKVMTILLALEAIEDGRISRDQQVTISKNAAGMGGSQVLLDVGEVQSVDILIKSMIVGSANDASVAMAELMYGSEELCAAEMNRRAAELGMKNTVFKNCTGLSAEGQHTTARDTAVMTMEMLKHDLYFEYSTVWMDEIDHGDGRMTQLTNTNKLTRLYDGCDGGKTGSTDEAGYCIAATAKRGDMRLIAVVLGSDSSSERFDTASAMLDYGFANYRLYPVAKKGTAIKGALPVEGGKPEGLRLTLDGDLTLLIEKGGEGDIALVPQLPENVQAPVEKGRLIGYVEVQKGGRTVSKLPVIAAESAEIKGIGGSMKKLLGRWVIM